MTLHNMTSQEMKALFRAHAFALKLNLQALASQQVCDATDIPMSQVLQHED
jgi:diadenosine tetraphosphate (Ap4A) HIT family hydrolase